MKQLLQSTLLIIVLTGCTSAQKKIQTYTPPPSYPIASPIQNGFPRATLSGRVLYLQCSGGLEAPVHLKNNEAWLFLPHSTQRLTIEDDHSQQKYSNGKYQLWINNDEAVLDTSEASLLQCRNHMQKARWEEARLRGADFRAFGHTPEWVLEISKDENTALTLNNSTPTVLFKTPPPVINMDKKTSTYYMNNGKEQMTVIIEGKHCHDPVSAELYKTTVTIELEGKKLTGCGRLLH